MLEEKEDIDNIWGKFIENQDVEPRKMRKEILDSWMRCKKIGVDPHNGCGTTIHNNLKKLINENQRLLGVAKPVMSDILKIVEGSGFAIVLTNAKGYVLEVLAETDMMEKMQSLSFLPGYLWTETMVGTNAIGTAIYIEKPIQTIGAEHYAKHQHSWTCSAAPIRDSNGKLIGCIDMSGDSEKAHSHTLGIVKVAAQSIERQLALLESHQIINTTLESILEGVIVLDNNLQVLKTNQRALKLLEVSESDIKAFDFFDIKSLLSTDLSKQLRFEWKFNFKNHIVRTMLSIARYGDSQGWILTLNEPKKMHKWANQIVGFKANYTFDSIITQSFKMKRLISLAQKIAKGNCNILIEGESGTGKELLAQSIHNSCSNSEGPFVAVNCASIPRELVESELFGYEKGAFTGASKEGHPGKFELADGGTIFLDEIGELPLDIQSKLLRVLDNNKITRVGGTSEKQLDIRVIGATNRILEEEIKLKNFREDLYYRLTVMKLHIPPLRERLEDIEMLVNYFVGILNEKQKADKRVDTNYIKTLCQFYWPGNIRELRNTVERDYHISGNILMHHTIELEKYRANEKSKSSIMKNKEVLQLSLEDAEQAIIQKTIEITEGNLAETARRLNIGRTTLYRKIKKYNINVS